MRLGNAFITTLKHRHFKPDRQESLKEQLRLVILHRRGASTTAMPPGEADRHAHSTIEPVRNRRVKRCNITCTVADQV